MKSSLQMMLAASAVLLGEGVISAAPIVYEGFEYTEGDAIWSLDGGVGWDGAWAGTETDDRGNPTVGPGLTFTLATTAGGSYNRPQRYGVSESSRTISTESQTALTADDSTVWFSVLMDPTHGQSPGPGFATNSNGVFAFGDAAMLSSVNPGSTPPAIATGGSAVGVSFDGDGPSFDDVAVQGVTYLDGVRTVDAESRTLVGDRVVMIVGRVDWAATGTNDVVTLYNIEDVSADLPEPFSVTELDLDQSTFNVVSTAQGQTELFDEIRFGATLEDVTPHSDPPPTLFLEVTQSNGAFDFSWNSEGGMSYDLLSSTDLSTDPSTWAIYDDGTTVYEDITASGTGVNTLSGVTGIEEKRFFVVTEEEIPPTVLLSADFEADNGGFTTNTIAGTDWAWGAPNSTGLGGSVLAGADSSVSCWGTSLTGFYVEGTETILRSPAIDLTALTAATLSYDEAIDLFGTDSTAIYLVDSTGTDIGGAPIYITSDPNVNASEWATVSDIAFPAAAFGQVVYLEFRLVNVDVPDSTHTYDYLGWYIDNVFVEGS